jgi:hypothetical protein
VKIARIINVVAICALLGAAVNLYRIKYDATLHAEHVAKLKRQISAEVDSIAVLRAEWAYLARPDRVQAFTTRHLDLKPLSREQTVLLASLPDKPQPVDEIGKKLEALGLMGEDASIALDKGPSTPVSKKPAPPAKKSTIAVKPTAQLKAPTTRPAPKPLPQPKTSAPLNITDFLRKNLGFN